MPLVKKNWLILALSITMLHAGSFTDPSFTGGTSNTNLIAVDSLKLDIEQTTMVRIYDNIPNGGTPNSRAPDILSPFPNQFLISWVDSALTSTSNREVAHGKLITLTPTSYTAGSTFQFYSQSVQRATCQHTSRSANGYFMSLTESNTTGKFSGCFNTGSMVTPVTHQLNTNELSPISSSCFFSGDTFLVTFRNGNPNLYLKKITASSSGVATTALGATIVTGATAITNSSIAVDSARHILVVYTDGLSASPKQLNAKLYSSDLTLLDSWVVDANASSGSTAYFYRDVDIISYDDNKFAIFFWKASDKIYCQQVTWVSDLNIQKSAVTTVISSGSPRFVTASCSENELVLAWKGDRNADNVTTIEGASLPINNGVLSLTPQRYIDISATTTALPADGSWGTEVNVAVDSIGNIGAVWDAGGVTKATILGMRDLLYLNGSWTSTVHSTPTVLNDSIHFTGGSLVNHFTSNGSIVLSIRVSDDQSTWGNWIDVTNTASLAQNAKGLKKYYQYKLDLQRNSSNLLDSLSTPVAKSATINWNVKPKIMTLDSVLRGSSKFTTYNWSDTVRCYSRSENIKLYYELEDSDTNQTLTSSMALGDSTHSRILNDTITYYSSGFFPAIQSSDTVLPCNALATDASGWAALTKQIYFHTVNHVPTLSIERNTWNSLTSSWDQTAITGPQFIQIQENDSVRFTFQMVDSNDAAIKIRVYKNTVCVDSADNNQPGVYVFRGGVSSAGGDSVRFIASDPDTSVSIMVHLGVNHFPEISALRVKGNTVLEGDSVSVTVGAPIVIDVAAHDTDGAFGDTLTYSFITRSRTTVQRHDSVLSFTPSLLDSLMLVIVADQYDKRDSFSYFFRFPWYAADSAQNPGLATARHLLLDSMAMIIGNGYRDTISVPIVNLGNDTFSIVSLRFAGSVENWMNADIPQNSGRVIYTSIQTGQADRILLEPFVKETLSLIFNPDNLAGDGWLIDTLFIQTSDAAHPYDTLPVRFRYDDLPQIRSLLPDFSATTPYWLAKSRKQQTIRPYVFPPNARVSLTFSEPMDTSSIIGAISAYSLLDSAAIGHAVPITLTPTWNTDLTQVYFTPHYTAPSIVFGNRLPPNHCYVPTDSIAFVISSLVKDRAANALDVDKNYQRDVGNDTVIALKVDSITFSVSSVSPASGTDTANIKPVIVISFNSPLYPSTIDTHRVANQSLYLSSKFLHGSAVRFDSVSVGVSSVRFFPAMRFYYGDSLYCQYHAVTGRDSLGYPIDANGDGVPDNFFDSLSIGDDVRFSFFIRRNSLAAVSPISSSQGAADNATISLRFNNRILPGTIDNDTSNNNRSLHITTLYSNGIPLAFRRIDYSTDSSTITFSTKGRFYGIDSIHCNFTGFVSTFNYDSVFNLPLLESDTIIATSWYFKTGDAKFYTYPNPYKPGSNPRHCTNPATDPCGIYFKNLNSLKPGITKVRIKVFTMNTHPVFATQDPISFQAGRPDARPLWKWDTRNNKGELVASGVYLYAIYDALTNDVLMKGKLMIVR